MRYFLFMTLIPGILGPVSAGPLEALAAYKRGDYENAFTAWVDLANHGTTKAQYYVGIMHINGQGTRSDPTSGAHYIEKAAINGYAPAQHVFGILYQKGQGVDKDLIRAYVWLSLAVMHGREKAGIERDKVWWQLDPPQVAKARLKLADLVADNRTGLGDDTKAAQIVKALAESGHAEAQLRLAKLYFEGRGVTLDIIESYKWHTLSAFRGNSEAQATDTHLQSYMTQKQIDEASSRAANWVPCGQGNREC